MAQINSSGSFIADLNLTIDNAPTNPNESAKEDFTIVIINIVVTVRSIKLSENFFLFDKDVPYLI